MILYGRNPVHEALRAGRRPIAEVWATKTAAQEPWLRGARVTIATAEQIEQRCGSTGHQGICAQTTGYPYVSAGELLARENPLIVALDELEDPQNVGAIARTAECVGATGLVLPERRSAEVTPSVCKASAGAVEHLRIARVRNVADFLGDAKAAGAWCYGASGEEGAVAYDEPDYRGGVVLVLGAEGKGLRRRVAQSCDALIALPLIGEIASLNVSAAAAALLYEILQQRRSS